MQKPRTAKHKHQGSTTAMRFMVLTVAALIVLTGAVFVGKNLLASTTSTETNATTSTASVTPTSIPTSTSIATPVPTEPEEVRVTLVGTGDVLMHKPVIEGGQTSSGNGEAAYDFNFIFQYVTGIFQDADLAMANFEGTLAGPPYSGYPSFSAPDAIADALYAAGIRVAWTANNHTIDKGLNGVVRTATVLRDKGLTTVGTRPDENASTDTVMDVGGIKIGLLCYTWETPGTEGTRTLNGINMPKAADPLIDSFNPYRDAAFERDMAAMIGRVDALRSQGAEFICLALHWGEEYQLHSSNYQRTMAQQLCDAGVDLIIGHHPHVIQEIDVLTSTASGQRTLVYYSLGNLVSNQQYNTGDSNGNAQDGILARVTLLKKGGEVSIEKGEYIPLHVIRVPKGDGIRHFIIPALAGLETPDDFQTTAQEMQASLTRIGKILGDSTGTDEIPVLQAVR